MKLFKFIQILEEYNQRADIHFTKNNIIIELIKDHVITSRIHILKTDFHQLSDRQLEELILSKIWGDQHAESFLALIQNKKS